jgi:hypothetical protein
MNDTRRGFFTASVISLQKFDAAFKAAYSSHDESPYRHGLRVIGLLI